MRGNENAPHDGDYPDRCEKPSQSVVVITWISKVSIEPVTKKPWKLAVGQHDREY